MNQKHLWGIDLGGTKIEAVIIEAGNGNIIARKRVPTLSAEGYDKVLSQISLLIHKMQEISGLVPTHIGMGTPGRLDPLTQTIKNSNTTCMNGRKLLSDLQAKLPIKFKIENDANCFALSEAKHMERKEPAAELIVGIILGSGVGGGIVANGKLISGTHGIAGEWGHNFLDDSGGECYCGREGCVETIISGPALERYYQSLSGDKKALKDIVTAHLAETDNHATATMERLHYFFGKGMAQLINVLDPTAIIIGGGVGNIDSLYTEGVAAVTKFLFNPKLETKFIKPHYGDSSGVFGAAYL